MLYNLRFKKLHHMRIFLYYGTLKTSLKFKNLNFKVRKWAVKLIILLK